MKVLCLAVASKSLEQKYLVIQNVEQICEIGARKKAKKRKKYNCSHNTTRQLVVLIFSHLSNEPQDSNTTLS